jgi:hypothetical protein
MSTFTHTNRKTFTPAAIPTRIPQTRSFDLSQNVDMTGITSHQFNQFAISNPSLSAQSCPLSIANPRACPTGGACHLCPGKS